jgi:hypothetical protein
MRACQTSAREVAAHLVEQTGALIGYTLTAAHFPRPRASKP